MSALRRDSDRVKPIFFDSAMTRKNVYAQDADKLKLWFKLAEGGIGANPTKSKLFGLANVSIVWIVTTANFIDPGITSLGTCAGGGCQTDNGGKVGSFE
jgi:hypothetical protein